MSVFNAGCSCVNYSITILPSLKSLSASDEMLQTVGGQGRQGYIPDMNYRIEVQAKYLSLVHACCTRLTGSRSTPVHETQPPSGIPASASCEQGIMLISSSPVHMFSSSSICEDQEILVKFWCLQLQWSWPDATLSHHDITAFDRVMYLQLAHFEA